MDTKINIAKLFNSINIRLYEMQVVQNFTGSSVGHTKLTCALVNVDAREQNQGWGWGGNEAWPITSDGMAEDCRSSPNVQINMN